MVWFEALGADSPAAGSLCRRHADALVLPNGWWLQDRRVDTALFPAPDATPPVAVYRPRRPRRAARPRAPLPLDPASAEAGLAEPDPVPAWTPSFDADDDLDGLLRATTPLLSRAFRRPEPQPEA